MIEYDVEFKQMVVVTFPFEMDSDSDVIDKARKYIDTSDQDYYTIVDMQEVTYK